MLKWETSYRFQAIPKSPIYAYEDAYPKKEETPIQNKFEDNVSDDTNFAEETVADSSTNPNSKNTPPLNNNNNNSDNDDSNNKNSILKLSSTNRKVKNDGSENSSENVSANNTQ